MIIFAIKSAITLAVLYSCFFLLLSRETFHRFNRWMLIGMMVTSLVVPFIHITTDSPTVVNDSLFSLQQELEPQKGFLPQSDFAPIATSLETTPSDDNPFNWAKVTIIGYLIGFAVMVILTIVQLVMIARNIRGGLRHTDDKGNTIVLKPGKFAPFSFFHYIVMSVDDYEHNRLAILTHEQEHIRLWHSCDNIFVSLMKILQWFNPFIYLLGRDLDAVHEYEADEAVINNGIDAKTYQQLLVVKATGMRLQTLVNGLNRNSLKKRIIMMYQKKSNRWLMLKAAFALPALVIAIGAFATPAISEPITEVFETIEDESRQMNQTLSSISNETTTPVVETIVDNPESPKETDAETSVMISSNDSTIIRYSEQHSRAKLEASKTIEESFSIISNGENIIAKKLWVIDDKEMPYESIKNMKMGNFTSCNVLSESASKLLFKERAPYGAVLLYTKEEYQDQLKHHAERLESESRNEESSVKEDEGNISDDVNDMLNVMDICPDDKAKLRGLYSLYFAAIAEAETLEKKYEESESGVYEYIVQAKEKRKYALKIMKKIEKAISKL